MSNMMREAVDWSLYPIRLMAQTMDFMTRTTCDVGEAVTDAVRPEGRSSRRSNNASNQSTSSNTSTGSAASSTGNSWSGSGDDLGGDDNKLVRSYVVSTKPGHEKAFEEQTELVSYDTTTEAYAGVVVGRFLRQHTEFSDDDMRYLKPHIEVIERYPCETKRRDEKRTNGHTESEAVLT
jgi:hypothetical protein